MRITVENYMKHAANLPVSRYDAEQKEIHKDFSLFKEVADEGDKTTKELLDLFIKEINEQYAKDLKEDKKKPSEKKKEPVKKSTSSPKSKERESYSMKDKMGDKTVRSISLEIRLLKRYAAMDGKKVTVKQILLLHAAIKKAATAKELDPEGPYKDQVKAMSRDLATTYNHCEKENMSSCSFHIPERLKKQITVISEQVELYPSVAYIRRFINVFGKDEKAKAKRLLAALEKAKDTKKVTTKDPNYNRFKEAIKILAQYVETDKWEMNEVQLGGFQGVGGIESIGAINWKSLKQQGRSAAKSATAKVKKQAPKVVAKVKKVFEKKEPSSMSFAAMAKKKFKYIKLRKKFAGLLGLITDPFRVMLYGTGGGGKSSLALLLAYEFANHHDWKVYYQAAEEGISGTMKEKIIRLEIAHDNIEGGQDQPASFKDINLWVIDSVDDSHHTPQQVKDICKKYPHLSVITIHHLTKGGDFKGDSDWQHDCSAEIMVSGGIAKPLKNRYGGKEEYKVY